MNSQEGKHTEKLSIYPLRSKRCLGVSTSKVYLLARQKDDDFPRTLLSLYALSSDHSSQQVSGFF